MADRNGEAGIPNGGLEHRFPDAEPEWSLRAPDPNTGLGRLLGTALKWDRLQT